jgi:hypothetical protein
MLPPLTATHAAGLSALARSDPDPIMAGESGGPGVGGTHVGIASSPRSRAPAATADLTGVTSPAHPSGCSCPSACPPPCHGCLGRSHTSSRLDPAGWCARGDAVRHLLLLPLLLLLPPVLMLVLLPPLLHGPRGCMLAAGVRALASPACCAPRGPPQSPSTPVSQPRLRLELRLASCRGGGGGVARLNEELEVEQAHRIRAHTLTSSAWPSSPSSRSSFLGDASSSIAGVRLCRPVSPYSFWRQRLPESQPMSGAACRSAARPRRRCSDSWPN